MILLGENYGGLWGKKTSQLHLVLLSLLPFFINKTDNLAEKIDMRFGGYGIKQTC